MSPGASLRAAGDGGVAGRGDGGIIGGPGAWGQEACVCGVLSPAAALHILAGAFTPELASRALELSFHLLFS